MDGMRAARRVTHAETAFDYLIYEPERRPGEKPPIVFFFHGMGERGSELEKVAVHGPPRLVREGARPEYILVCPQCPADTRWDIEVRPLLSFIDGITAEYGADEDRIYITGLSMGGYGTWALAGACPEKFAAAVPICGGCPLIILFASGMKNLSIWAFHGDKDEVIPVEESIAPIEALQKMGGDARLTVYEGVGHDSWTRAYNTPELYEWMLLQKRKSVGAE